MEVGEQGDPRNFHAVTPDQEHAPDVFVMPQAGRKRTRRGGRPRKTGRQPAQSVQNASADIENVTNLNTVENTETVAEPSASVLDNVLDSTENSAEPTPDEENANTTPKSEAEKSLLESFAHIAPRKLNNDTYTAPGLDPVLREFRSRNPTPEDWETFVKVFPGRTKFGHLIPELEQARIKVEMEKALIPGEEKPDDQIDSKERKRKEIDLVIQDIAALGYGAYEGPSLSIDQNLHALSVLRDYLSSHPYVSINKYKVALVDHWRPDDTLGFSYYHSVESLGRLIQAMEFPDDKEQGSFPEDFNEWVNSQPQGSQIKFMTPHAGYVIERKDDGDYLSGGRIALGNPKLVGIKTLTGDRLHIYLQNKEFVTDKVTHWEVVLPNTDQSASEPQVSKAEDEEKQEVPKSLAVQLAEARKAYLEAESKLNTRSRIMTRFRKKETETLNQDFEEKKSKYEQLAALHMVEKLDRYHEEQDELLNARWLAYGGDKRTFRGTLYDVTKKVGNFNLIDGAAWLARKDFRVENVQSRVGRVALGVFKVRTVASLSLLGVGLAAGSALAAGAAFGSRYAMQSGLGGIGAYDLFNNMRESLAKSKANKKLSNKDLSNPALLNKHIAAMESRVVLSGGSLDNLRNNPLYKDLSAKRDKLFEKEYTMFEENPDVRLHSNSEVLARNQQEYLAYRLKEVNDRSKFIIRNEKDWRTANKVLSTMIATGIVGAGLAVRMANKALEVRDAAAGASRVGDGAGARLSNNPNLEVDNRLSTPEVENGNNDPALNKEVLRSQSLPKDLDTATPLAVESKPPFGRVLEILRDEQQTGAKVEYVGNNAVVNAGKFGIEGSLADLKSVDSDRYQKMVAWLQDKYDSKASDLDLIHRFVEEHRVSGKNLDRIAQAQFVVGDSGQIDFDVNKVKYLDKPTEESFEANPAAIRDEIRKTAENISKHFDVDKQAAAKVVHEAAEQPGKILEFPNRIVQSVDGAGVPAREAAFEWKNIMQAAPEIDVSKVKKTSEALYRVFGSEMEYKVFLRTLRLDAKAIDSISGYTMSDFYNSYNKHDNFTFKYRYQGLMRLLQGSTYPSEMKMRDVLINIVRAQKNASIPRAA